MEERIGACLPWMNPEDFESLRIIPNNPANLPLLYDDWLRAFENTKKKLQHEGEVFILAEVNGPMFTAWCLDNGRNVHHQAWIEFLTTLGNDSQRGG